MAKKETPKKVDIFGAAKKVEKPTSKSTDKTVVEVDKMEKKLNEYKFLNQQIKALEAKVEAVRNNIIEVSKEKFIELYRDNGRNPKTFILKDGDGCVMVIPYDAYAKIKTQERADEIIEKYGEEAVNINEKYVFNNDVLERNMDVISKLIGEAKNISTEDKENLIRVETTYEIKKGFIDNLYRDYEDNMEEVLDDVKPTIALKDCGDRYEEGGVAEDADLIGYVYEDNYEAGGIFGSSKRPKSALMRDRAYKSEEAHEIAYKRKKNPKNPRYKHEEGGSMYESGGGVDGRSTRDKSTWNSGAAWTRDRNEFNKSEDWEVPMSKRKHEEGGSMYEAGGNIGHEISREELESKVGRKLNGWGDDTVICEGVTYKKCFLKPYYKKA